MNMISEIKSVNVKDAGKWRLQELVRSQLHGSQSRYNPTQMKLIHSVEGHKRMVETKNKCTVAI
jgi:hypothetical protein